MRIAIGQKMSALLVLAPLVVAGPAQAHMFGLIGGHSATPATADSPISGSNSLSGAGSYDFTDDIAADLSFGVTKPLVVPGTKGTPQQVDGGTILNASLGGSWQVNDHVFVMVSASLSPQSTTISTSSISLPGKPGDPPDELDSRIKAVSSSAGGFVSASWETGGDSDFESSVALTAIATRITTKQDVLEITPKSGPTIDPKALDAQCKGATKPDKQTIAVCKRFAGFGKTQADSLAQMSVGLSLTETLYTDWDAIVGATVYSYAGKDPNAVGSFSVANKGKGATSGTGATSSGGHERGFGEGIDVSPLAWAVNAGVVRRLGPFKITLAGGYSKNYASTEDDPGHNSSLGAKLQYKISDMWRVIASGTGQSSVDETAYATFSYSLGATVRCIF